MQICRSKQTISIKSIVFNIFLCENLYSVNYIAFYRIFLRFYRIFRFLCFLLRVGLVLVDVSSGFLTVIISSKT